MVQVWYRRLSYSERRLGIVTVKGLCGALFSSDRGRHPQKQMSPCVDVEGNSTSAASGSCSSM
eukprot:scaffold300832_cov32-Tisochrysis_lutea.AAC.2